MAATGCELQCQRNTAMWILLLCVFGQFAEANLDAGPISAVVPMSAASLHDDRRRLKLVEPEPIILTYHNGPVMSQVSSIAVYLIWYGTFSTGQKTIISDFFSSFGKAAPATKPSVNSWWKITDGYIANGAPVAGGLHVAGQLSDASYSKGKVLKNVDLESLVVESLSTFPSEPNGMYYIFTASDVDVDDFCMNSCASHFATTPSAATNGKQLPYVWVGNAAIKCADLCAWPFAKPEYGPPAFVPLLPPNGDVGIDGMIINIAAMAAGTATNPFGNGYFQGDAAAPLEAATACAGIYGPNAYPGFPGDLLTDKITKASYNANGTNNRKFLLPALWDPKTLLCTVP